MRIVILVCLFFATSCASQSSSNVPNVLNLKPYQTVTPTLTPSQPEGLVVSFETPLASPTPFTYTIVSGDTMSQIAQKFNLSLDALLAANPNVDPNAMPVGHTLQIPSNPINAAGEFTPTPAPVVVQQISCHPSSDAGMWCFALIHNDSSDFLENITAQVTLIDANSKSISSQTALIPLNILPPYSSLPVSAYFVPVVPSNAKSQVRILTAIQLLPGDPRYLPATIQDTLVQVDWSGSNAQLSGAVRLPDSSKAARIVWVAAVAYDEHGNVVGVRRWESNAGLAAGGSLPFSFMVSSVQGIIERVEFAVEARP